MECWIIDEWCFNMPGRTASEKPLFELNPLRILCHIEIRTCGLLEPFKSWSNFSIQVCFCCVLEG